MIPDRNEMFAGLPLRKGAWQGEARRQCGGRSVQRVGGGILIAIGLIAGSLIGVFRGEPSAGLLGGLVVGLVGAGLVALWDSRRR